MKKRNPDGSKRRHSRPFPRAPRAPVADGFSRLDEATSRGSSDSVEEFVSNTFGKLIEYVLKEIKAQESGEAPLRPFDANGQAAISLPASMNFSIKGAHPEDPDGGASLRAIRANQTAFGPTTIFETTRAELADALATRVDAIAQVADMRVRGSEESGLLQSFALLCFLEVTDTRSVIEIRFDLLPPSPFQTHVANDPATS